MLSHRHSTAVKGYLQSKCKLILYERVLNVLESDMCVTEIGGVALEYELGGSKKMYFSDFLNPSLLPK